MAWLCLLVPESILQQQHGHTAETCGSHRTANKAFLSLGGGSAHGPLRRDDGPAGVGRASPGTVMPGAGKVPAGGGGKVVAGGIPGSSGPSIGIPPLTGEPMIGPETAGRVLQSQPGAAPIGIGVLKDVPTRGGQHSGAIRRNPKRLNKPSRLPHGPQSNRGVAHPVTASTTTPRLVPKSCRRRSMRDPPGQSVASTLARLRAITTGTAATADSASSPTLG